MMFVAIDLGGTNTRIALFQNKAVSEYTLLARFKTHSGYEERLAHIESAMDGIDKSTVAGIGLAIGVQLTPDGRTVDASFTMPNYVGKAVVPDLVARLDFPVVAANDLICGAIAEYHYGSLGDWDLVAYLTVSTGTGAGIYLRSGDTAVAYLAQIGHHILDPAGRLCSCGQVGCLQTFSGAQEIKKRAGRRAADIDDDLFWDDVAKHLAVGIVNLARISRVQVVCVGGGIGLNNRYLRQNLAGKVRECSPNLNITLTTPTLGADAPIIGANLLGQHRTGTVILH
jgi:predicted NBD/HSP70 family sugar kinase